ncbi:MAG: DNA polymerase III subunit beta [Ruminococcaceae bacterium]|nr:DNA polymerase III subunit beta [Oscillospiraceae bacterium]
MKFTCEKLLLQDAIASCIHAVSSKSTITALEGLLISAGEQHVTLSAYNFKTAIIKHFDATVYTPGSFVLNARIFYDIVRKLPDDIIEITIEDNFTTTIKSGVSEYNIIATSADEFPELPSCSKRNGISIKNNVMKSLIDQTVFAVSDNETKPIHTGCLFEVKENLITVVAVDGYRLALRKEEIENESGNDFKFVVPGDTLKDILRILPENEETSAIYPDKKHALFEIDNTVVITRLLEGEFLDYNRAIPQSSAVNLTIDVRNIKESIERVSLIISERLKNPIRCIFFDSSVKISCITALGKAYDEAPISFCPEQIEIGFNNKYIMDALKACTDETVSLGLTDGVSPAVIRPTEGDKYVYMVLPVRLKQA